MSSTILFNEALRERDLTKLSVMLDQLHFSNLIKFDTTDLHAVTFCSHLLDLKCEFTLLNALTEPDFFAGNILFHKVLGDCWWQLESEINNEIKIYKRLLLSICRQVVLKETLS